MAVLRRGGDAIRICPAARAYYVRKRAEGKYHRQALLALARRRVDVLWAFVRDGKTFQQPIIRVVTPTA